MIKLPFGLLQKIKGIEIVRDIDKHIQALSGMWKSLQDSERALLQVMNNNIQTEKAAVDHGPILYVLNHDLDPVTTEILRLLKMPKSSIDPGDWKIWKKNVTAGPGVVADDGTLFLETIYANLDPKWFEALVYYIFYKLDTHAEAPFATNPATYYVGGQLSLSIAVIGDWGTGEYSDSGFPSPASLVGNSVKALRPDITIHLGDVYYAGKAQEETDKLLHAFPEGKLASFTLNSNHEMYDGANGYFKTALANKMFVRQQGTSYFAIRFFDWIIIGFDSSYYDKSSLYMDGTLNDSNQISFIKSLGITKTQKVILMSHHNGVSYDGKSICNPLFGQVYAALGRYPDYWYYGHLHNGIVYSDLSVTGNYTCPSGTHPKLRCIGHGAIPFAKAKGLHDAAGVTNKEICYYAHTAMPNPANLPLIKFRVLNGYSVITLQQGSISEQVYEVSVNGTQMVWNN